MFPSSSFPYFWTVRKGHLIIKQNLGNVLMRSQESRMGSEVESGVTGKPSTKAKPGWAGLLKESELKFCEASWGSRTWSGASGRVFAWTGHFWLVLTFKGLLPVVSGDCPYCPDRTAWAKGTALGFPLKPQGLGCLNDSTETRPAEVSDRVSREVTVFSSGFCSLSWIYIKPVFIHLFR